jgi:hypothetical protein
VRIEDPIFKTPIVRVLIKERIDYQLQMIT